MYLLTKYIKSLRWGGPVRLSYIQDAWCLKVNTYSFPFMTVVARKIICVTFIRTLPVLLRRKKSSKPSRAYCVEFSVEASVCVFLQAYEYLELVMEQYENVGDIRIPYKSRRPRIDKFYVLLTVHLDTSVYQKPT